MGSDINLALQKCYRIYTFSMWTLPEPFLKCLHAEIASLLKRSRVGARGQLAMG